MSIAPPTFYTVPARSLHSATVILMHGMGDSGNGMQTIAEHIGSSDCLSHVKWILPRAPLQSVSVSGGRTMPAWYDILAFTADARDDEAGMLRSIASVSQLIAAEMETGIGADRIVVGGLSQGASLSLLMGLTIKEKLAGIVMLSGRMIAPNVLKQNMSNHATSVPIFIAHGEEDQIITLARSKASVVELGKLGFAVEKGGSVTYNIYPGVGHSAANERIMADLKAWLKARVGSKDDLTVRG